ncbi:MAG: helix-turn-helix domain-containing protein [Acidobacteriota bacterium]
MGRRGPRNTAAVDQERRALDRFAAWEEGAGAVVDRARAGDVLAQGRVLQAVDDAVALGARQLAAAEVLGLSPRTLQRWRRRA